MDSLDSPDAPSFLKGTGILPLSLAEGAVFAVAAISLLLLLFALG